MESFCSQSSITAAMMVPKLLQFRLRVYAKSYLPRDREKEKEEKEMEELFKFYYIKAKFSYFLSLYATILLPNIHRIIKILEKS